MPNTNLTVATGLQIASRHPSQCAQLLANNLYPLLSEADWFTPEWRAKFCAYFLQDMADQSIEKEVDHALLERVKQIRLSQAIKLLGSSQPEAGLKLLVALVCIELRDGQHLGIQEQYQFYDTLFGKFFPDCRL